MQHVTRHFSLAGLLAGLLVVLAACGSGSASPASSAAPAQPNAPSASAAQPGAPGGPRLTIDKPVIDFGKVAYGQRVTPVWKLTNSGTAALQIKDFQLDVKEGC